MTSSLLGELNNQLIPSLPGWGGEGPPEGQTGVWKPKAAVAAARDQFQYSENRGTDQVDQCTHPGRVQLAKRHHLQLLPPPITHQHFFGTPQILSCHNCTAWVTVAMGCVRLELNLTKSGLACHLLLVNFSPASKHWAFQYSLWNRRKNCRTPPNSAMTPTANHS